MRPVPHPHRTSPPAWRLHYPPDLPIVARRAEIVRAIREHPVVVLSGETGSGKTTQLPKFCLEAGRGRQGRIACTQPRRVAALSVSRRVAEEMEVPWGREVGCKIRFADRTSPETVVKFLTDGMLLAEAQGDRELRGYDTIIVDEAHERSLNIDFLLGHLNLLRHRRPELRIVVTSATIDTQKFSAAFGGAPIIEVSGRTFPVEIVYAPLDELRSEEGEFTVVDAAVAATERVCAESHTGDILVFHPGEREIRETADLLARRDLGRAEILPLFSRLSAAEQQRVFASGGPRKIIIATNVAETSLTIPGIRFVIDSGLARLSRYVPRNRTRRLPIEPISRSSANQRAGRAGRVAAGVCIRLFDEEDFARRPAFTQPELQRANLADVILRLLAGRLGEIETFPFIDPPSPTAIAAGYALLEELGAMEPAAAGQPRRLSPLGLELARLPVDPTVGRMLLQARNERALREVSVIAAALSIQDPRERPLEMAAAADAAHRKFLHPESDFLTLLHIWDAYHDEAERLSLGRLKKFCRAHFLNFNRMREWFDVHAQLAAAVAALDSEDSQVPRDEADAPEDDLEGPAPKARLAQSARSVTDDWRLGGERYRAVHRALLTGLLANVARRDETNRFHATGNRKAFVFPGSTLFLRSEKKSAKPGSAAKSPKPVKDLWLVAAEMVETTRLYARTNARLDPAWVLDVGEHILRRSYGEPDWHPDAGRVLVRERTLLHGLEVQNRTIDFGHIDAPRATEIFIRGALVGDTLETPLLPFLAHNRRLRAKVATIQTQVRSQHWLTLEEAAYEFFAKRLAGLGVSSVHDLQREYKRRAPTEPRWLHLAEEDLLGASEAFDPAWFPDRVVLENRALPLDYLYRPGTPEDGITLRLPYGQAKALAPAALDWLVPGHLEEKVQTLLRTLPKAARGALQPLEPTARTIAAELRPDGRPLVAALAAHLAAHYRLTVAPEDFRPGALSPHLQVRIEVVDAAGKSLAAGRELATVQAQLAAHENSLAHQPDDQLARAWRDAQLRHERTGLTDWSIGDLPSRLVVAEAAGVPVVAYPALVAEGSGRARVQLCRSEAEARGLTPAGVAALVESQLSAELTWLERDLGDLRQLGPAAIALMPLDQWRSEALACIRNWVCREPVTPLTREAFVLRVATARTGLKGIVWRLIDVLRETLALRTELLTLPQPYAGLTTEVQSLIGPGFLARTPWLQLPHLPRYLRARLHRANRWRHDPGKDHRRSQTVAAWHHKLETEAKAGPQNAEHARQLDELHWLLEEFRVSVFAQELGTAQPVSEKKLEQKLSQVRAASKARPGAAPAPALIPSPPPAAVIQPTGIAKEKPRRVSSLGDLGRLLG